MAPTVPRKLTRASSSVIWEVLARLSARSTFSMPPSRSLIAFSWPSLLWASLESSSYPAQKTREMGELGRLRADW